MAVTCLNRHQKKYIKYYFNKMQTTITELSKTFKVSRRTIKRVLEESNADE